MMRTMILLGAALSLWAAGNTHAAEYVAGSDGGLPGGAAHPRPCAWPVSSRRTRSLRVPTPHEPRTHSLLLVAIGLLSLRMRTRAPRSEKFST